MNEKIKQLLLDAGGQYSSGNQNDWPSWVLGDVAVTKFAELIVKECIAITDELVNRNADGTWTSNELYTDYNGALSEVKRRITEHFGS